MDGLKPGQRKVIFTCIKRNDKREVKVAQLAGSVAEHSAYHHGKLTIKIRRKDLLRIILLKNLTKNNLLEHKTIFISHC